MRVAIIFVILCTAVIAQAQTPLEEMVKTEQAFSKMAADKNTREAFMTFIADDGLLFRPGAVNGKKWMLEHPVPPSDKKPLLAWQPNFAGMSASGDMGFTTGPWEAKPDVNDPKPSAYGHFVTVWKKQPDGTWKFVVDLGISHPQSGGPQTLWHPTEKVEPSTTTVESAKAVKALVDRDRILSLAALEYGLAKAFESHASPDVRVYRTGNLPFIGRSASEEALKKISGKLKSQPIGGDVSHAGDLGYTHGTYEISDAADKVVERGSYVRIWRNQGGAWRVVLDVTNVH
ncbi:MAG TPA: nuclear transport factor 2 family protein [Pyrinomonadaceae bacterium]|nr:nuclear transport factor 2 family protein [Pyrinomonadaceae bacterium]